MSKNKKDDFLSKFGDRVEKVGRDGVMGLMKTTGIPINNVKPNFFGTPEFRSFSRKNGLSEIHKNILEYENFPLRSSNKNNLYMKVKLNDYPIRNNHNYSDINYNKENSRFNSSSIFPSINNNKYNPDINYENVNNSSNNNLGTPLLYSLKNNYNQNNLYNNKNYFNRSNISNNSVNNRYYNNKDNNNLFESQSNNISEQKNIYSVANNRQNIVDYGYTPYTLKDYKKINNDVKLGKLGPNIGTEEWKQKRKKMKKMSEYGNKIMHEGRGCYVKLSESADERHKRLQEMKMLNGKWNIINEYSKSLLLNNDKNSNEQFKRNVNKKLIEEESLIDKQFELDMEREEEEERILQQKKNAIYQQRLNKMKNLLFK